MFDKAKQLYKLQREASKIKKQLQKTHIESELDGIVVVVSGEQEVIEIRISDEALASKKLGENITKALNKALKKAQQVAADLMKDIMGDLQLPGM